MRALDVRRPDGAAGRRSLPGRQRRPPGSPRNPQVSWGGSPGSPRNRQVLWGGLPGSPRNAQVSWGGLPGSPRNAQVLWGGPPGSPPGRARGSLRRKPLQEQAVRRMWRAEESLQLSIEVSRWGWIDVEVVASSLPPGGLLGRDQGHDPTRAGTA